MRTVELDRIVPSIQRAAMASCSLDRSRWLEPDVMQHGCADCLDAHAWLPTGGFGYATVIGSYANVSRE